MGLDFECFYHLLFERWVWATFEGSLEETSILISSRLEMHIFHLVQWPVTKYINCSCSVWSISALNWNRYAVNLSYLQSAWTFIQISTFSFTVSWSISLQRLLAYFWVTFMYRSPSRNWCVASSLDMTTMNMDCSAMLDIVHASPSYRL